MNLYWKLTRLFALSVFSIYVSGSTIKSLPVCAQDWKPGDPITFGGAHKPLFDSSSPAGSPGSSRLITPTSATTSGAKSVTFTVSPAASNPANAATQDLSGVPENFLNSRSIEWKPGDPVSFGSAHKPYSPPDNRALNSNSGVVPAVAPVSMPSSAPGVPVQASPASFTGGVPSAASMTGHGLQDLAPNPSTTAGEVMPGTTGIAPASSGQFGVPTPSGNTTTGEPANNSTISNGPKVASKKIKQKTRPRAVSSAQGQNNLNQAQTTLPINNGNMSSNDSAQSGGNKNEDAGNIFTHAFRWMGGLFGSNK